MSGVDFPDESVNFPIIRTAGGIVPDLPGSLPDVLRQNADRIRENRRDSTDVFDHAESALSIPPRQSVSGGGSAGDGDGLPIGEIVLALGVFALFSVGVGQLFTFEVGS